VILDPVNDEECLGQLTTIARELAPTTLVREVARRLGSREAVIRWFQSLPQADDDGTERVRFIQCDVPQRTRLLPDNPNCVERSLGGLMLLEAIDPMTPRALATVDRPMRHTGLVEKHGGTWRAVDLFPRRNAARDFSWSEFGKDVLQGVHKYVGKPVLSFYGLGGVADTIGEYEDKAIGRHKPKDQQKKPPEKKDAPPSGGGQPKQQQPKQQQPKPQPQQQRKPQQAAQQQKSSGFDFSQILAGAGAILKQPTPSGGGGKDAQETQSHHAGAAPVDGAAGSRAPSPAGDRDGGDSHGAQEDAQRGRWWFLDR
jgi:hypothetical protein